MRRLVVLSLAALLTLGGVGALVAYLAAQHTPEFYAHAVAVDSGSLQAASAEMFNRADRLRRDVKRRRRWEALFSAEQINGYLAVDLEKQFPGALPAEVSNPRIDIGDGELTIACRYDGDGLSTVLWLTADVYLAEPNTIAVRIRKVRAGAIPIPVGRAIEALSQAARSLEIPLRWRQADGDPVALVDLPPPEDPRRSVVVEMLQLQRGEVYVAGSSAPAATRENR